MTDHEGDPNHPRHGQDVIDMREIRDRLIEICQAHERELHGGGECLTFRFGAVGYVTHCLGLSTEHVIPIVQTIALYENNHVERIHPHPEI